MKLDETTIAKLADELFSMSRVYQQTREASNEVGSDRARGAMTGFARALWEIDRFAMEAVYDAATEKYGADGVTGVSSAWTGVGGWSA